MNCPACKLRVRPDASGCPHCGAVLRTQASRSEETAFPVDPPDSAQIAQPLVKKLWRGNVRLARTFWIAFVVIQPLFLLALGIEARLLYPNQVQLAVAGMVTYLLWSVYNIFIGIAVTRSANH